jgi:hypothetical protein
LIELVATDGRRIRSTSNGEPSPSPSTSASCRRLFTLALRVESLWSVTVSLRRAMDPDECKGFIGLLYLWACRCNSNECASSESFPCHALRMRKARLTGPAWPSPQPWIGSPSTLFSALPTRVHAAWKGDDKEWKSRAFAPHPDMVASAPTWDKARSTSLNDPPTRPSRPPWTARSSLPYTLAAGPTGTRATSMGRR